MCARRNVKIILILISYKLLGFVFFFVVVNVMVIPSDQENENQRKQWKQLNSARLRTVIAMPFMIFGTLFKCWISQFIVCNSIVATFQRQPNNIICFINLAALLSLFDSDNFS